MRRHRTAAFPGFRQNPSWCLRPRHPPKHLLEISEHLADIMPSGGSKKGRGLALPRSDSNKHSSECSQNICGVIIQRLRPPRVRQRITGSRVRRLRRNWRQGNCPFRRLGRLRMHTRPTEIHGVTAYPMVEQINRSGSRTRSVLPRFIQTIPDPCLRPILRFIQLLQEGLKTMHGYSAKLIPHGVGCRLIRHAIRVAQIAPENLDIGVISLANVPGNIEVVPRDVRRRVKEIH